MVTQHDNDFSKALENLKKGITGSILPTEQTTVQSIRQLRDELRMGDSTVTFTLLNGSTVSYLVAISGETTRDILVGEWVIRGS